MPDPSSRQRQNLRGVSARSFGELRGADAGAHAASEVRPRRPQGAPPRGGPCGSGAHRPAAMLACALSRRAQTSPASARTVEPSESGGSGTGRPGPPEKRPLSPRAAISSVPDPCAASGSARLTPRDLRVGADVSSAPRGSVRIGSWGFVASPARPPLPRRRP